MYVSRYAILIISIAYFQCEVDIREIREVRRDNNSKDFKNFPDEFKKVETEQTFVIMYGSEFNLKSLSLAGECVCVRICTVLWMFTEARVCPLLLLLLFVALCAEEKDAWTNVLNYVMHPNNFQTHRIARRYTI